MGTGRLRSVGLHPERVSGERGRSDSGGTGRVQGSTSVGRSLGRVSGERTDVTAGRGVTDDRVGRGHRGAGPREGEEGPGRGRVRGDGPREGEQRPEGDVSGGSGLVQHLAARGRAKGR